MTAIAISEIREELDTGPLAAELATVERNREKAEILNRPLTGATPVAVDSITGAQALTATDLDELGALEVHKREAWLVWCAREAIDATDPAEIAFARAIFPGGAQPTETFVALKALLERQPTRVEQRWGRGLRVTSEQIAKARAL